MKNTTLAIMPFFMMQAVAALAKYNENQVDLPAGYTNPSPSSITPVDGGSYTVDIPVAGVEDADPIVGAGQLITALQTDFNTVQAVALKLDALATVDVRMTVQRVIRLSDGDDSSVFQTGTLVFRCSINYEYQ